MRVIPRRTWILALAALTAACGTDVQPTAPDNTAALFAKGGNSGNRGNGGKDDGPPTATLVADVVAVQEGQIASTCSGEVTSNYGILFGHSGCLVVSLDDYDLTDDLSFSVKTRKGEIQEMILTGQDVIGDAGVMHETDNLLGASIQPSSEGFTVSVRRSVPVYRLSGHLRGKRVGIAGFVYIGDIVYRPQE